MEASPSANNASSSEGSKKAGTDKQQHWWEYYPITLRNSLSFVKKLEFETSKTIGEIINYSSPDKDQYIYLMKDHRKHVKLEMMRKTSPGDHLILKAFQEILDLFPIKGNSPFLYVGALTDTVEKLSEDRIIFVNDNLILGVAIPYISTDLLCKIFPIKRGLLEIFRLKVEGNVEIGSVGSPEESRYKGEISTSTDLVKDWADDGVDLITMLEFEPKIPFTMMNILYPNEKMRFCIDISLEWSNTREVESIPYSIRSQQDELILSKLLESKVAKDFRIVAGNGAEIRCHQLVLSMSSPFFEAMLSPGHGMKESREGRLELTEWTNRAVECLVDFLYGKEILVSSLDCDLALELLQMGHAYQLTQLCERISELMLKKEVEWFSTDVVIELYYFVMNLDCFEELKKRLPSILNEMSSEEIFSSERFKELGPSEAMKLMGVIHDKRNPFPSKIPSKEDPKSPKIPSTFKSTITPFIQRLLHFLRVKWNEIWEEIWEEMFD